MGAVPSSAAPGNEVSESAYQKDALAAFEDKPSPTGIWSSLPASISSCSSGKCRELLPKACGSDYDCSEANKALSCCVEGFSSIKGMAFTEKMLPQDTLSLHESRQISLRASVSDRLNEIRERIPCCPLPVESCGLGSCCAGPAEPKDQGDDMGDRTSTNAFKIGNKKNAKIADVTRGLVELQNMKHVLDGVHYSDPSIDKVHWLQFLGQVMWPFVQEAITKYIVTDLSATIRGNCADIPMLSNFTFTQCDFGKTLPVFEPLTTRNKDNGIELDLTLDWKCEGSNVEVDLGGLRAGMKDIRIQCSVLLLFCPLLEALPITGGLGICFPNPPELDFEWTGMGRAFPAAKTKDVILKAISDAIVVPNRVFVNIAESSGLIEEVDLPKAVENHTPPPLGVLRIEVLEARDLPPTDLNGSSDPYCRIQVGTLGCRTKTMFRTLEPRWSFGEGKDFLVYHPQQHVQVKLYDEDQIGSHDLLGAAYVERRLTVSPRVNSGDNDDDYPRHQPTVAEVIDNPSSWWPLDIRGAGHNEDKFDSAVRLKVKFARTDKSMYEVRPHFINCPKGCGLVEDNGRSSKLCGYCNRTVSQSWTEKLNCASSKRPKGWVCRTCQFGVCHHCWIQKRPACGLLRVVLKSAHVPPQHAQQTAVVSFEFEGETVKSRASKLPFDIVTPWTSKPDAVNNLHWHAGLSLETVGRCLGMPLDEAKHLLNEKPPEVAPTIPATLKDMQGRHTVVWDEAFHFLVLDPSVDTCELKIVYKSGGSGGFLLGTKGQTLTASLNLAELAKKASDHDKKPTYWLTRFKAKDIECRVTSSDKNEKNAEAVLYLEVRFEALTGDLLDNSPTPASSPMAAKGDASASKSSFEAAKKKRQSQFLFAGNQTVW